jgi:hypothetical protein
MSPQEIIAKLGIEGATIRLSDNEGYYWASIEREHQGRWYSRAWRIDLDPTDAFLSNIYEDCEYWWAELLVNNG